MFKLQVEERDNKVKYTYIIQVYVLAHAYLSTLLCCNAILIMVEILSCYCYYTSHETC